VLILLDLHRKTAIDNDQQFVEFLKSSLNTSIVS